MYSPFVSFVIGYFFSFPKIVWIEHVDDLDNSVSLESSPLPSSIPNNCAGDVSAKISSEPRQSTHPSRALRPASFPGAVFPHWRSSRLFTLSLPGDLTHW